MEMFRRDSFREHVLHEQCAEVSAIEDRLIELETLLSVRRAAGRPLRVRRAALLGLPLLRELRAALHRRHGRRGVRRLRGVRPRARRRRALLPVLRRGRSGRVTTVEAPPALECPQLRLRRRAAGRSTASSAARGCRSAEQDAVRASAPWLVPVLVALVVAAVAAAGVVAYRLASEDGDPELVATTQQPAEIPTTAPPELPTATAPPAAAPPAAPPPASTQASPPADQNRIISWPQGRSGHTIVLASLPRPAAGPPRSPRRARRSTAACGRSASSAPTTTRASIPATSSSSAASIPRTPRLRKASPPARDAGYNPYVRPITQ